MNIAIVSLQFEKTATGGGGVHVQNITQQFLKLNHNVTILSIHTNRTLPGAGLKNDWQVPYSIENRGNLQVVRFLIDENIEHPYVGDKDTELDRIMRFAQTVVSWIEEHLNDYDVVSLHGHHIIPGWIAKQLHGKAKLVTSTIHALESTYVTEKGIGFGNFQATQQMLSRLRHWEAMAVFADYIIVNSLKVRSDFIAIATGQGYDLQEFEHKIVIISSGVTLDFLLDDQAIIQKLKQKPQTIRILTFSRIDPSKGHEFAIMATGIAARQLDQNFELSIVGIPENQQYVEKLKQLAQDLPQNVKINFDFKTAISPPQEKKQILDNKHIYILPSLQEPFGMSIIEASARGNMIISNDTTGPMFMMEAETKGKQTDWGYITPYGALAKRTDDPFKNLAPNLAKAIIWTIENWDTGYKRVLAFNERIRKYWTWEGIARQYIQLFSGNFDRGL